MRLAETHRIRIACCQVQLGLTTMMSMMVIVGVLADSLAKSETINVLGTFTANRSSAVAANVRVESSAHV